MIGLLTAITGIANPILDKIFPDKEAADKAKAELTLELAKNESQIELAAAGIIKSEAASTSWLASSWRPITMLTFTSLVVGRWMGWVDPNLSEAEILELWKIIGYGIGGYIPMRTIEKALPLVTDTLKTRSIAKYAR